MQQRTKEFLTKLATLMQEYEVEFEITESYHGYNGYTVDGLEIGVAYVEVVAADYSYNNTEYVELQGRFHSAKDVFDLIGEK